jgi:hypothetical protein
MCTPGAAELPYRGFPEEHRERHPSVSHRRNGERTVRRPRGTDKTFQDNETGSVPRGYLEDDRSDASCIADG